jgi:hypothetical protein
LPFLGRLDVPPEAQGHVVLTLAEERERGCRRRLKRSFKAILKDYRESKNYNAEIAENAKQRLLERLVVIPMAGHSAAWLEESIPRHIADRHGYTEAERRGETRALENWLEAIKRKAPPEGYKLIAFDPAASFCGPDAETNNAAATRFVELLDRVLVRLTPEDNLGPTILFAHHTRKQELDEYMKTLSSQGAARGSSAFTNRVRWQANMAAVPSEVGANTVLLPTIFYRKNTTRGISLHRGRSSWKV